MTFYSKGTKEQKLTVKKIDLSEDKDLITAFKKAETKHYAFNLLVEKYKQRVYWHIRKMVYDHDDTSDLTQEVFVKIWKNLEGFRGDAGLFTWIYKIATNECLNFLSKKKKFMFLPLVNVEKQLAETLITSELISGDEVQLKLQHALLTLPAKQRLVFNMKYFEDLTYEEMSDVLGTSVGALKASFHLAVKKIHDYISKNY